LQIQAIYNESTRTGALDFESEFPPSLFELRRTGPPAQQITQEDRGQRRLGRISRSPISPVRELPIGRNNKMFLVRGA
jgi:hypothetical protein